MKIGIYGGSFNPIHWGHVGLAKWVIEHTDLDELWLMVSPNNPLKDKTILADEQERLEAARKAVEGIEGVEVSDFEFALPRPTYTAETLRALEKRYPENEFVLVIGEDNWRILDKWREWQWIVENHEVYVYPRHGEAEVSGMENEHIKLLRGAPYFDVSSTQIRQEIKKNAK